MRLTLAFEISKRGFEMRAAISNPLPDPGPGAIDADPPAAAATSDAAGRAGRTGRRQTGSARTHPPRLQSEHALHAVRHGRHSVNSGRSSGNEL